MTRPSDETLMAYADDALPAVERLAVTRYLLTSPDDQQLVDQFRRSAALAKAGIEVLGLHPQAGLIAKIRTTPAHQSATPEAGVEEATNVVPFLKPARRPVILPRYALPLAAGLALMLGFGGGYFAGSGPNGTAFAVGPVDGRSKLSAALDRAPSGVPVANDASIMIVATFTDRNGRNCREFERLDVGLSGKPIAAGVACRTNGKWAIEGAARIAAAPAQAGTKPSGMQERDALSGLLDMLGAGPSMSRQEEQVLIEGRWR